MSWETVKIADVANVLSGFAFKSKELGDEGIPVLKIGNIQDNGNVDILNCQKLPETHWLKKHEKFRLKDGDILIAMTGATAGKVGRIKAKNGETFLLNQRVAKFEATNVDPDFLWFAIGNEKYRSKFYSLGGGAAQPNMSGTQIGSVEIKTPDLPSQKRIAGVLSAYGDLIENNRRRIALLEESARLVYREWFVHFRFPNHENTKFENGLPVGWEMKTFDDVCQTVGGGTPSTKVASYWENGDITWITPTDITKNDCLAVLDSEKKITSEGLKTSSAKMVPAFTILMTSRASVGFFGLADRPVCTNQGFINIIPNAVVYHAYLLFNLMNRVKEIRGHASGSTYAEISKSKFRSLPVLMPSEEIGEMFADIIQPKLDQVRKIKKHNQALTKARDLLLPRLMDGRIDV